MLTNRQISERNRFFGKENYRNISGHLVTYKSVINENEIILRTSNIFSKINEDNEVEYLLALSNDKAVYLPFRNIAKSAYCNNEGRKESIYLVKINQKYFHARQMAVPQNVSSEPEDYHSLYLKAMEQGKRKLKVEFR